MKHRHPNASPTAKSLLSAALFAAISVAALATGPAAAQSAKEPVKFSGAPVRVGEINSYTGLPAFTIPYRQGWQLALEEINAQGGVIGCCEKIVLPVSASG